MLPHQIETQPEQTALDTCDAEQAVLMVLDSQIAALHAVRDAAPSVAKAARIMAKRVASGGTLIYAAAGSSGLMALADVSELPGTFGIPVTQLRLHMAGGVPVDGNMPGQTEDDTADADAIAARITEQDCLIALSASGTTPYPMAIAEKAAARGACVISITNTPDTPLLNLADIGICIPTAPEVLAGSTRLGAGTAQKAALNMMSTLMGVHLGHVYQGRMVNLIADNAKLLVRATGIVRDITGVQDYAAQAALETANGDVKLAILIATGLDVVQAKDALIKHKGHLAPCLTRNDRS